MTNKTNLWEAINDGRHKVPVGKPNFNLNNNSNNNKAEISEVVQETEVEQIVNFTQAQPIAKQIYEELKAKIQKDLTEKYQLTDTSHIDEKMQKQMKEEIELRVKDRKLAVTSEQTKEVVTSLLDDLIGLGPLQKVIDDPRVEEIRVNQKDLIYVVIRGKKYRTDVVFDTDEQVYKIANKIASNVSRPFNYKQPWCDARLKNGSRVNMILDGISLKGNSIVIRKFYPEPFSTQDLINYGSIDERMATIIDACVKGRLNIIVAGGTASGKTSSLNWISTLIPESERIITIEDAAELKLKHKDWVSMETRMPTQDNPEGGIDAEMLLKNSLRMSPDRIIVGECRDGRVAMTMLSAMNTGHEGSMSTIHSNSARDTLIRLETMILMSNIQVPVETLRKFISSSLDLIIYQAKLRDGSRKITSITEVGGVEGSIISTQDIFTYVQEGIDKDNKIIGHFESAGVRPVFMKKLEANGITIPKDLFSR